MASGYSYGSNEFFLEAHAGEYQAENIGSEARNIRINASFGLEKFYYGSKYTPAAYVGLHQGEDRTNSFQFIITNNGEKDKRLIAGYRVIENGEEVKYESLEYVEMNERVKIKIEFNDGLVEFYLNNGSCIKVKTNLEKVRPYISVSSGAAKFLMSPNKSLKNGTREELRAP